MVTTTRFRCDLFCDREHVIREGRSGDEGLSIERRIFGNAPDDLMRRVHPQEMARRGKRVSFPAP